MRLTNQHIVKGVLLAAGLLVILLAVYAHACSRANRFCPGCGSARVSQIRYGMPNVFVGGRPHIPTVDEIGYLQGGCLVEPYDRYCRSCRLMWSRWRPWERMQARE